MLSVIETVASFVHLDFQNPNCELLRILCLPRTDTSLFGMTFSSTLEQEQR